MKVILGQTPNPKQMLFFKSRARHTAYGGARGGGKSWAMRTKFVLLALRYPGLKILLLRRTLAELKENHIVPLLILLKGIAIYNNEDKVFKFPNGSRLKLGYCDTENDVYQYQGQEYDVIGFEEATHFTETQMQFLTTCNRTTRKDFTPRMYYTCNPGGVGHGWVKRLFVNREYQGDEDPDDYLFIRASIYDNTVLMQSNPEYLKNLKNLPDARRRAYLDGDWDVLEGQYFEEFRRDKHVIAPFDIPKHWRRFRSMDWGYSDPCCVLWHAVDGEGRVYTYRELRVNQTIAGEVAKKVVELTGDENISYTVASPDMWHKRGNSYRIGNKDIEGESTAETFGKNGVVLLRADNSRIIGWQRMREYMAEAPDGIPYWQIFDCCRHLIRTIPEMIHDDHNAEDIADGLDDHQCEAARYGFMSRPAKTHSTGKPKPKPYNPLADDGPKRGGFFTT